MKKKSDSGVELKHVLKHLYGISDKTTDNVMSTIRASGEHGSMKIHHSKLSGDTKSRLHHTIESTKSRDEKKSEKGDDKKPMMKKDEKKPVEKDSEKKPEKKPEKKKEKMAENEKPRFRSFLLELLDDGTDDKEGKVTVDVRPEDIKDPNQRREAMRQKNRNKNTAMRRHDIMQKIKELQQELKNL